MSARELDFTQAVKELLGNSPINSESNIAIIGGELQAGDSHTLEEVLERFLHKWDFSTLPYRIWEYFHCIEFNTCSLPSDYSLLERGRIFGPGGDLSLRRDGERFLWHFIGPKEKDTLPADWKKDFWKENPHAQLRPHDEFALLWGAYKKALGRWHEDRVGWANLDYPYHLHKEEGKRLWIHYTVFSDGGQIAFVWWKEVKDHAEKKLDSLE